MPPRDYRPDRRFIAYFWISAAWFTFGFYVHYGNIAVTVMSVINGFFFMSMALLNLADYIIDDGTVRI